MSELYINNRAATYIYGVQIETPPRIVSAVRKASVIDIPGGSQPLVRDLGGAEMIQRVYDVFIDPSRAILSLSGAEYQTRQFLCMLLSESVTDAGFFKLSDSYIRDISDYNYFFKARFAGGAEFENVFSRRSRGQLIFDCVPRMYIDSKSTDPEYETVLESVGTQLVTEEMPSVSPLGMRIGRGDPLITIYFSSNVNYLTLTVDGFEMLINLHKHGDESERLYIDCELKNCWYETYGQKINGNADVTFNTDYKFPTLTSFRPIITAQTTSGTVNEIAVRGRWYVVI